jgi:hypothetical protein
LECHRSFHSWRSEGSEQVRNRPASHFGERCRPACVLSEANHDTVCSSVFCTRFRPIPDVACLSVCASVGSKRAGGPTRP